MNPVAKLSLLIFAIIMFVFVISTIGHCSMTFYEACTYGEPSVSVAEYEPETTPDIYDV